MRTVLIGIDASLVNCGVAVLENGSLQLFKGSLLEAVEYIRNGGWKDRAYVVIEDPNKDSTAFGLWVQMKTIVLRLKSGKAGLGEVESLFRRLVKQAQNVGESKAAAKVLIAMFERAGMPVVRIAPSSRDRADKDGIGIKDVVRLSMPTKTNAMQFDHLTNHNGRSNEHNRDAATLVWGKTPKWCEVMIKMQEGRK